MASQLASRLPSACSVGSQRPPPTRAFRAAPRSAVRRRPPSELVEHRERFQLETLVKHPQQQVAVGLELSGTCNFFLELLLATDESAMQWSSNLGVLGGNLVRLRYLESPADAPELAVQERLRDMVLRADYPCSRGTSVVPS
jgi:hypothetical protein